MSYATIQILFFDYNFTFCLNINENVFFAIEVYCCSIKIIQILYIALNLLQLLK